jgi:radical SAM superfamily enzyme YgiQ (UPF0313 family)
MPYNENEILLVNPTGGWDSKKDSHYFFPIGLLYLKNYLLRQNIPSTISDVNPQGLSPENFKQMVIDLKPKIIGFTGSPFERHTLHTYIQGVKKLVPQSLVVVGGPYFTATARECLLKLKDVDVVVRGEGEKTFLELVRCFEAGGDFSGLRGITYRDKSGGIIEKENNLPCNRDECEIDIDLLRSDNIYTPFVYLKNFEKEKIKALPVLLARGCTMRCTFCFNNNNARFLSRSTSLIIEEIKAKREKFKCDYFWLVDPTFTLREKFAGRLCSELKKHCPGIKWYCETRADCSLELIKEMSEAGCISIDIALESGSPKVLKAIRKDLDINKVIPFTAESKKHGIRTLIFVMYNLPGETYNDFLQTMKILKKIKKNIYTVSVNETLILPGTQMEKQAKEKKLLPDNFSWYDPGFSDIPRWKSPMTDREIAKCQRKLFKYEYLLHNSWPGYLRQAIRLKFVTFLQKNENIKNKIKQLPAMHRFLKAAGRTLFGRDSL